MAGAATYRLQLGPEFDLTAAAEVVGYLADLGISHVYCSPFLQSAPDAPHGYAVVDPHRVDDRLGGEEGRRKLVEAAAGAGLGIVIDLVPNHMAVSLPSNRWLWEVLEHGRASRYAGYFDVDWDPPESSTHDKVLLPVLGDHYGREIEAGTIRVQRRGGEFNIRYRDQVFPASPRSVARLLEKAASRAASDELAFVARALAALPPADVADEASRRRRHADAGVLFHILSDLLSRPGLGEVVDDLVAEVNGNPADLDEVLEAQHYRLARWQVSGNELGYRRFFDIDTLIGLRVEDPEVFADSHDAVLAWTAAGEIDGLRIDHPDGLRRPGEYLRRLRQAAPDAWIVVEKVLEGDETLPEAWPVEGTTGYEFLTEVTNLLVDPEGEAAMTRLWQRISGREADWGETAETAKRDVLSEVLGADLNRLTAVFARLLEHRPRYRDFTRDELSSVLAEALVAFDVYRTYVTEMGEATPADVARITAAIERARRAATHLDPELFDLLGAILAGEMRGSLEAEVRMRFQQLSGPVMAKGVEDTAFYRYLRLAALCEVGGDPGRFGSGGAEAFHAHCRLVQERWPLTMLALSTHDTKRSEDVRARLAVLSEMPGRWEDAVMRWSRHVARHRSDLVDGATEYLVYQTLVGAYPIGSDRLLPYLEKATKEAKLHTSWTEPDPDYDAAIADFALGLADDGEFQQVLASFVPPVIQAGRINSLVQKTLQLTAPGVPDTYQGTELWDLSLVDPDNRRPVRYGPRRAALPRLERAGPATVLAGMDEGLPKLWLIRSLLQLRRSRPGAFGRAGDYRPLPVSGRAASHTVAYTRGDEIAVVVPRLTVRLADDGGWGDTAVELPDGQWRDMFTRRHHAGGPPVDELLSSFPVAVLERA